MCIRDQKHCNALPLVVALIGVAFAIVPPLG